MTPMPETPWYLGEDYDPSEIVFDDKGGVKAGTLRALVARLTPHGSTCMYFLSLPTTRGGWATHGEREEREIADDRHCFFPGFCPNLPVFYVG
jgi:hypothetical protein